MDKRQLEAVEALLESGADAEGKGRSGRSPLHNATRRGHAAISDALLRRGGRPDVADDNGRTPLLDAARDGFSSGISRFK